MSDANARAAILRSCGMLYLFRALDEATDTSRRAHIEAQIIDAISDMTGALGGAAVLTHRDCPAEIRSILEATATGIPFLNQENATIACPVQKNDRVRGFIAAWFAPGSLTDEELDEQLDTLIGIATLAGYAISSPAAVPEKPQPVNDSSKIEIPGVIAESQAMQRVLRMVRRVAPAETTVLIEGESGTGKEVVAKALHDLSPRRSKPFIAINCAVLTENLLESELFGHERGAFTGAVTQKKGKVELADGGTLFLDEIGELAPGLQAKLLRVLQQREFERVGGTKTMRLDVRVIAATNRDLAAEVKKGGFREDLYHRLNVIALTMPPLRERPDDVLPLARHFLAHVRVKTTREVRGIGADAEQLLLRHAWSGNVRELENAIERAVILGETEMIDSEDLPPAIQQPLAEAAAAAGFEESVSSAKKESILKAWAESNGDYKQAAAILGLHPNSLLRLVKKMNLRGELR